MDIYRKSLSVLKWAGVALTVLLGSMNVAYSHEGGVRTGDPGYRGHLNVAYHGGYHRGYNRGYHRGYYHNGYRGYRTGFDRGWRRGYWGGAYMPGVVTYRNRCWVQRFRNHHGVLVARRVCR